MIYTEDYKIKYINKFFDINEFGLKHGGGNIHCVFHSDAKPSARIYSKNSFYCFRCGRHFYPINIIWKENLNIENVFNDLFKKYGHQELEVAEVKKEEKIVTKEGKSLIQFTKEFFDIK